MFIKWILLAFVPVLSAKTECAVPESFAKVNSLLQSRRFEDAANMLDGLKNCHALSELERFNMGWLYGRARKFQAALVAFRAVPENVPDLVTHQYAVALALFELEDYRGSTDVLKTLRSNPKFDPKCANLLAVSDSKLALYQDAYLVLAQEIRDHPEDLQAYLNLVTVCTEGGNFAKAVEVATEAGRRFPQSQEVLVVQGAANTLLGHLDKAQKNFSAAIQIAPQAPEPRFFLALTEYKLAQFADAAKILQSAIGDGVVDADLHYLLAECLLKIEPIDQTRVLDQLNQAIELNSNSVSARTLRGKLLLDAGQAKRAVVDLELASHIDGTSRSAAYNLARAYRAEGKTKEAQSLFTRLRSETGDTLTELGDKRLNQALKPNSNGNP